jgi:hypothetical protein
VFQDPFEAFNPFYRIDHALLTPLKRFRLAASAGEARARMEAALAAVGLRASETLGRYPHQLSGGQRRARDDRARAPARAEHHPRRRAGLDGRRFPALVHPANPPELKDEAGISSSTSPTT